MATQHPNDPCPCGSGLKYKHCHRRIDAADVETRPVESKKHYASAWQANAACFEKQGCYEWMAKQLETLQPTRILDVGCGDGRGINALVKAFPGATVIGVDENEQVLANAEQLLDARGTKSDRVERLTTLGVAPRSHVVGSHEGRLKLGDQRVTLIEGDILVDDELFAFLRALPPFDVVTIWLSGSHMLRSECDNIRNLKIASPKEYRFRVQNKVYELAEQLLRAGGVLHIVDRGQPLDDQKREGFLESHRDQASVTTLVPDAASISERTYAEPTTSTRVPMTVTGGATAMTSILARKR